MILPWWRHGGNVSWHDRYDALHDHGMIIIHLLKKNGFFVNVFSNSVLLYGTLHLPKTKRDSRLPNQPNWTQLWSRNSKFLFDNSFNITLMLQLFIIFSNFKFLGKRLISVKHLSDSFWWAPSAYSAWKVMNYHLVSI